MLHSTYLQYTWLLKNTTRRSQIQLSLVYIATSLYPTLSMGLCLQKAPTPLTFYLRKFMNKACEHAKSHSFG